MPREQKNIPQIETLADRIGISQLIEMFDLLPDSLFWIKDAEGHFIHVNSFFLEHHGISTLNKIVGHTDFDFSPQHLAEQYYRDDQKVLKGEVVSDRLETNTTKSGEIAWFTTSKRPLFDHQHRAIASYGISRHLGKTSLALLGMDALKKPVTYIRENYMNNICLDELAEATHLSISALERRFKKHLNKTPKQFINETRMENARRLLIESNMSIANIAGECGFSDHSYFSKQFNLFFGQQPSVFREIHCSYPTPSAQVNQENLPV